MLAAIDNFCEMALDAFNLSDNNSLVRIYVVYVYISTAEQI